MKKDNKGFSLVELIVVVLIMGILAVALTPQVLKWVNRSRIATDFATMDTVASALQTTLTNEEAYKERASIEITITKAGGVVLTDAASKTHIKSGLESYLGVSDLTTVKFKSGYTGKVKTNTEGKVSTEMWNDASPSSQVTGVPED